LKELIGRAEKCKLSRSGILLLAKDLKQAKRNRERYYFLKRFEFAEVFKL